MKISKKSLALLLIFTMMLTMLVGCGKNEAPAGENENQEQSSDKVTGKFEGEAAGYGGIIKVEVELDEGEIKNIDILDHNETVRVSDPAIETIPEEIIKNQTVAVDAVGSCTVSSMGIKMAVENALKNAGVNVDDYKNKIGKEEIAKTDEEKQADVVIVGGGGAGLSAAVSAFENGAESVILIEKMPALGGNTILAGGAYNAVNPEKQKAQGIEDSVEHHFNQTYEGGHKVGNPELIKVLTENALDGVQWLEGYGLEWKEKIGSVVGAMWERSNQTQEPLGTGYINVLEKTATDKGCEILLNTKATELVVEDGKVVGVKAEGIDKNYTLLADKGVIMATGGYAANAEMVREYLADGVYTKDNLPEDITSTNAPGLTGEGILMAEDIGASVIDMEHIQLLPMPGNRFGPSINVEDSFFINKEGNRYVKEDGGRDELCLATFEQTDGKYYMINDSKVISDDRLTLSGEKLDVLIDKGIVVEAETLEELAKAIDVPAENLVATCEKFNEYVDKKEDPEFGRAVWGDKIDQGPFYATLRFPALHHTMGGLEINTKAQVLDANKEVIPGLFAAGEVTGGIHGANRLGGNAIADIVVFGKIAGRSVMED